jgi:hypothetical protein
VPLKTVAEYMARGIHRIDDIPVEKLQGPQRRQLRAPRR